MEYTYSQIIDRILKSKEVSWKIKQELRSGKNCTTCKYGGMYGWCDYNIIEHPSFFHHLMICENYSK